MVTKKFEQLMVAMLMLTVGFLVAAHPTHAQDASAATVIKHSELRKLIDESDAFHAAINAGEIPQERLSTAFKEELARLTVIEKAIRKDAPSLAHTQIYGRLGATQFFLGAGKGSLPAEEWFKQAVDLLEKIQKEGGPVTNFHEQMAVLLEPRGRNLVLLGQNETAQGVLELALSAVQTSTLDDQPIEAAVRQGLANILLHQGQWAKTLKMCGAGLDILNRQNVSDFNKRSLLWYQAVSTSRLGKDALPLFGAYVDAYVHDKSGQARKSGLLLMPQLEADVYHEAFINLISRAPRLGVKREAVLTNEQSDELAKRDQMVDQAQSYIIKARQLIDLSQDPNDLPQKASIYTALGDSYGLRGELQDAERTFKEAIALVTDSPNLGENSPVAAPVLLHYAVFLHDTGRREEAVKLRERAKRIEAATAAQQKK